MGNDDFVRVPREPTIEMCNLGAGVLAPHHAWRANYLCGDIYRAMLSAAPPSAPSGDNVSTPSGLEEPSAAAAGKSREVDEDDLEPGELRPCPFCGGEAERIDFDAVDEEHENAGGSCIGCTNCGASSPVVFGYKETLYSSWNERSRLQPAAASEAPISAEAVKSPDVAEMVERHGFTLTWHAESGSYRVSKPNIGTMDVVPASLLQSLARERGRLREAVESAHGQFRDIRMLIPCNNYEETVHLIADRAVREMHGVLTRSALRKGT